MASECVKTQLDPSNVVVKMDSLLNLKKGLLALTMMNVCLTHIRAVSLQNAGTLSAPSNVRAIMALLETA